MWSVPVVTSDQRSKVAVGTGEKPGFTCDGAEVQGRVASVAAALCVAAELDERRLWHDRVAA